MAWQTWQERWDSVPKLHTIEIRCNSRRAKYDAVRVARWLRKRDVDAIRRDASVFFRPGHRMMAQDAICVLAINAEIVHHPLTYFPA